MKSGEESGQGLQWQPAHKMIPDVELDQYDHFQGNGIPQEADYSRDTTGPTFQNLIMSLGISYEIYHLTPFRRSQSFPESASRKMALSSSVSASSYLSRTFSFSGSFRRLAGIFTSSSSTGPESGSVSQVPDLAQGSKVTLGLRLTESARVQAFTKRGFYVTIITVCSEIQFIRRMVW